MKNYFFEAHIDFCNSSSYFDFTNKITQWAETIFGFKNVKIAFCRDNKLVLFEKSVIKEFDYDIGIFGLCAKNKTPMIISNNRFSKYFNGSIDINTLLPVINLPLLAPGKK